MYDTHELRDSLRQLADALGETPSKCQCNKADITPSSNTYRRRFGSWNDALKAAGLSINERSYTDAELIDALCAFADRLGETPTYTQLTEEPEMPSARVYADHFDDWNAALRAAGLDINEESLFSDEELLSVLQDRAAELGHTPSRTEMDNHEEFPSSSTYETRFGSWNSAIQEAELSVNHEPEQYDGTDQELLDMLRAFGTERDTSLTQDDVNIAPGLPSATVFAHRFGGWNAAKQAAGLDIRTRQNRYTDAELLHELRRVAHELDRSPTERDIREADAPSIPTYQRRFGSWSNALEEAGLVDNQETPTQ